MSTFVVILEIDQGGDDCCDIVGEYSTEQWSDAEAQAVAHANVINNTGGSAVVMERA